MLKTAEKDTHILPNRLRRFTQPNRFLRDGGTRRQKKQFTNPKIHLDSTTRCTLTLSPLPSFCLPSFLPYHFDPFSSTRKHPAITKLAICLLYNGSNQSPVSTPPQHSNASPQTMPRAQAVLSALASYLSQPLQPSTSPSQTAIRRFSIHVHKVGLCRIM